MALGRRPGRWALVCSAALLPLTLLPVACQQLSGGWDQPRQTDVYPPAPQKPRIVALGTLRGGPPPTKRDVELSVFLFGTAPPPPLTIANPTGLAAGARELLICDGTLGGVFRWDAATDTVSPATLEVDRPYAISMTDGGDRLAAYAGGVVRVNAAGQVVQRYELPGGTLRAGGVLAVGNEVWVTNLAAHCIEIFEAAAGTHKRSLGSHGRDNLQFALPRGMARMPSGDVCVVDTLNNRVQVVSPAGEFVRRIGGPGDVPCTFGRPKDVAVGRDGTVFVTDAFSQRVHVFASDGTPLMAFGEPRSGPGRLALPNGIAILDQAPGTERKLPDGLTPRYYVVVSEQLDEPGIRVYAWLGYEEKPRHVGLPAGEARNWQPSFPESVAINPHWDPRRCDACHTTPGRTFRGASGAQVDALCVSCHDGTRAPADPHPIGRPASTDAVHTPAEFPTPDGLIGCLTCHDIQRHCDKSARRPAVNYVLLRGFDPQQPLAYCLNCHQSQAGQRFSPHQQRDATGKIRDDACFFCHTQKMQIPADGRRRFEPHLRTMASALCLNCHTPHWDLSPQGHVDRPVTPEIRDWMVARELSRRHAGDADELLRLARQTERPPAHVPLGDDMVTCYSCHNPHYTGLFPRNSELGALANNPADRKAALRTDWIDLCSECHHR